MPKNIDITVVAGVPKLTKYIDDMIAKTAKLTSLAKENISISDDQKLYLKGKIRISSVSIKLKSGETKNSSKNKIIIHPLNKNSSLFILY